jgi:serum/glucocorticoid-regulated kinase 2
MITGRPPFMHSNQNKLANLIKSGNVIFPDPVRHNIPMSDNVKDLISKLLDKNPKTRIGTADDANEILSHPWFADGSINVDDVMNRKMTAPFIPDLSKLNRE